MRSPLRALAAFSLCAALLAACSTDGPVAGSGNRTPTPEASTPSPGGSDPETSEAADETEESEPRVRPVSVLGLAEQRHQGDRLRLGAVREATSAYTSYDVTYRSSTTTTRGRESYTISGVLNVPNGRGPFPAVVLAHGYIDPAIYVRGQGMTRERAYLASRGYIALHVDYRNHAESDDDPRFQTRMRLGYSADVINAVKALRRSPDVPVDDDRIAYFGRSMGGGVILKALIAEPGLVQAAAPWASVSSLERENYDQFIRPDPEDAGLRDRLARRYGTPEENPQLLARELLSSLLRPDHRTGPAGARSLRRHLPAPLGVRDAAQSHASRRAITSSRGTTTDMRSGRRSTLRWTGPSGSSTNSCAEPPHQHQLKAGRRRLSARVHRSCRCGAQGCRTRRPSSCPSRGPPVSHTWTV